jgi:hypothetical protein
LLPRIWTPRLNAVLDTIRVLSLHTLDNVVDALDGGDGVDETGVDIIDALDIFLVGAGTHESKDFTEKEIRTWDGARSGSPAAGILAARGSYIHIPYSIVKSYKLYSVQSYNFIILLQFQYYSNGKRYGWIFT